MLVSKRYLLIFNVFMIITGVTVGAYGYLIRPVATVGLMSDKWIYSPKNRGPYPEGVPLNNVLHLAFSSDYPTTIYVEFQEMTRKLASNVTELGMHFTLKDLGANTTIKSWALTYFDFEPSRTPCAMRFNLAFERPYPRLGRYFSASGIWFLAAGIGPHCYLWISKKLEEAATRMFLKLTLILSYFWTFVSIYYVFLGSDPHPHQPFYAAPLMRSLMLPLAISGTATIVVFVFTLSYYLLFHASFSIKLGFLFLFGFFLLLAVLYLRFAYAFPQNGIPIFLLL